MNTSYVTQAQLNKIELKINKKNQDAATSDEVQEVISRFSDRFDTSDNKLEQLNTKIEQLDEHVQRLEDRVDRKFDHMDERLEKIERRFKKIDHRLEKNEEQLEKLSFDQLSTKEMVQQVLVQLQRLLPKATQ